MKKTKLAALFLALAMLIAALAGCTNTTPADSGEPADPAAPAAPAEEPAAEPDAEEPAAEGATVQLKLYMLPQDDDSDIVKQRFEFIREKVETTFPNYEIEWTRMAPGTDYRQQYDKLLMSGDGPTLWNSLPFVDIQTRMRNGTIAEITDYVVNWTAQRGQGQPLHRGGAPR